MTVHNSRKGFSLIEGILAAALLAMLVTSLAALFIYGQESTRVGGARMVGVFLAEEGMEAVRNIRDDLFANLPADSPATHGLDISGNEYVFSGTSDLVGIYTRTIEIENETLPTRKKVIVEVTWPISPARTGSVTIEEHFTDWIII